MCFNIAHYFMNTLLPWSSFCYRISRTPAEEAENSLSKIISKNELNLHGICIAVVTNQTTGVFIMGVRGSRKGYGNPKRISFLLGFSFPLLLEPCGPWQLNVMAICARQEQPLHNWPLVPQPIHRTATARLAVDTTFTMETSISRNL